MRHRQLACVPKPAESGAVICVIFSGQVPYVLRRKSNGDYTVVGECYLDRVMH